MQLLFSCMQLVYVYMLFMFMSVSAFKNVFKLLDFFFFFNQPNSKFIQSIKLLLW